MRRKNRSRLPVPLTFANWLVIVFVIVAFLMRVGPAGNPLYKLSHGPFLSSVKETVFLALGGMALCAFLAWWLNHRRH